jgi:hypothetical protein
MLQRIFIFLVANGPNKLECMSRKAFQPSLMFVGKAVAYPGKVHKLQRKKFVNFVDNS